MERAEAIWREFSEREVHEENESRLIAALGEQRRPLLDDGFRPALTALLEERFYDANLILLQRINPKQMAFGRSAQELYAHYDAEFRRAQAQATYAFSRNVVFAAAVVAFGSRGGGWGARQGGGAGGGRKASGGR